MIFKWLPKVISCKLVWSADSENITVSPMAKSIDVIFTISISVAETLEVICATAPVVSPYTFSPITDSVSKLNPEGNVNLSSVGDKVFVD